MPIKSITTTEGVGGKEKKISKIIYRTSSNIRIINMFLESQLSESLPSLGVTAHLTSLGCPMLISGPAMGLAYILSWSFSCVFLPPISTAIRTIEFFSSVGVLNDLIYIP